MQLILLDMLSKIKSTQLKILVFRTTFQAHDSTTTMLYCVKSKHPQTIRQTTISSMFSKRKWYNEPKLAVYSSHFVNFLFIKRLLMSGHTY